MGEAFPQQGERSTRSGGRPPYPNGPSTRSNRSPTRWTGRHPLAGEAFPRQDGRATRWGDQCTRSGAAPTRLSVS